MNSSVIAYLFLPLTPKPLLLTECCRYDMYQDIEEKLAAIRGLDYPQKFICGLPVGLELPNGIVIGAAA